MIVWITGLSGAGKTTIAKKVCEQVKKEFSNTVFLDGDILREVLGVTGYSYEERYVQALKIHALCEMLDNQGINVVCATMSLFHKIHKMNRDNFREYCEIYIDVELEELIKRDQKKLYSKALKKEVENVVGVDIVAEVPQGPDLVIDNNQLNCLDEKANKILRYLKDNY